MNHYRISTTAPDTLLLSISTKINAKPALIAWKKINKNKCKLRWKKNGTKTHRHNWLKRGAGNHIMEKATQKISRSTAMNLEHGTGKRRAIDKPFFVSPIRTKKYVRYQQIKKAQRKKNNHEAKEKKNKNNYKIREYVSSWNIHPKWISHPAQPNARMLFTTTTTKQQGMIILSVVNLLSAL